MRMYVFEKVVLWQNLHYIVKETCNATCTNRAFFYRIKNRSCAGPPEGTKKKKGRKATWRINRSVKCSDFVPSASRHKDRPFFLQTSIQRFTNKHPAEFRCQGTEERVWCLKASTTSRIAFTSAMHSAVSSCPSCIINSSCSCKTLKRSVSMICKRLMEVTFRLLYVYLVPWHQQA